MTERNNKKLKILDMWLGGIFLFLCGLFVKKTSPRKFKSKLEELETLNNRNDFSITETSIRKIGILKSAAIGDTVILSPVIKDLARHFPNAKIKIFTGGSNFEIAKLLLPDFEIVKVPIFNPIKALSEIRKENYDLFFDFDSWPRISAIYSFLSRSNLSIGFKTPGQYRHYCFNIPVLHDLKVHEIENYRNLVRVLGVNPVSLPCLTVEPSGVAAGSGNSQLIVFHPWAGGSQAAAKSWPNQNWVELAKKISSGRCRISICTGPSDDDKSRELVDLALASGVHLEVEKPINISCLVDYLNSADLVIAVDSGIAHIAGALGKKVIGLYGPTSPDRWGALGTNVGAIKDNTPATINLGFEIPLHLSLQIVQQEVLEKIALWRQ